MDFTPLNYGVRNLYSPQLVLLRCLLGSLFDPWTRTPSAPTSARQKTPYAAGTPSLYVGTGRTPSLAADYRQLLKDGCAVHTPFFKFL